MGRALTIDSGDTAWMLVSTALVLMMLLPGLALFYGGLVRAKNLLSVMSQAMGIAAVAILTGSAGATAWPSAAAMCCRRLSPRPGSRGSTALAWAVGSPGKAIPELVFAASR